MGIIGWDHSRPVGGAIAKAILQGGRPWRNYRDNGDRHRWTLVGGFIAGALDIGELGDSFDIGTWLIAIAGSVLLLLAYRALTSRRGPV